MPSILEHHARTVVKLLLMADSGAGKTGGLASLAAAGYNLRVADIDNGIDALFNYLLDPKSAYAPQLRNIDLASAVRYVTLNDPMKAVGGEIIPSKVTVWERFINLLSRWKEGDVDLGPVSSWTPQDVLVVDSFSFLAAAALWRVKYLNNHLAKSTSNEYRRDIGGAQQLLTSLLQMLYSDEVKCNVIVTSHITFADVGSGVPTIPKSGEEASGFSNVKGYPSAVGRALSPHIPRYFNNSIMLEVSGSGQSAKHEYITTTNGVIGLKSSAPMRVKPRYPISTGLADIFRDLRGE